MRCAPVRVALLGVSPLLQELVTSAVGTRAVVETTGQFSDVERIVEALPAMGSDAVLIAGPLATPQTARRCLATAPDLSVVTLTRGGRDATVYRRELTWTTIEGISPKALVDLLDEARAREPPEP